MRIGIRIHRCVPRDDEITSIGGIAVTTLARTLLDLSLTGVSVRSEVKPPVGEHILIGTRAGRVARHHNDGIGVEFLGLASANPAEKTATIQTLMTSAPRPTLFAAAANGSGA